MIRRDFPRGAATPDRWLLISQPDHALLSRRLAEAWGSQVVEPLVCPSQEPDHPLARVRCEVLAAIEHHDDGWIGWIDAPLIDPGAGRPLAFTEMPTAEAQRIWTDSITACRAIGPLAGWMAASHFAALQSRGDRDEAEWADWSRESNRLGISWRREWLAASEHHTEDLAERCLAWLQTFDWISLWLCCRCPAMPGDEPVGPLEVGGDGTGWPKITFEPESIAAGQPIGVRAIPWPLGLESFELEVATESILQGNYFGRAILKETEATRLTWRLVPQRGSAISQSRPMNA